MDELIRKLPLGHSDCLWDTQTVSGTLRLFLGHLNCLRLPLLQDFEWLTARKQARTKKAGREL